MDLQNLKKKKKKEGIFVNRYFTCEGGTWQVSDILRAEFACLKISLRWVWTCLSWKRLQAFHKTKAVKSLWYSFKPLYYMTCKHEEILGHETALLQLTRNQSPDITANGTSHRIYSVVSSFCSQKKHLGSICTFRRARLDFVGRTLQQALHINVWIFGGTFRDHNLFCRHWS